MALPFEFTSPTPLGYFTALVRDDEALPLFEAAASVAQDEYPELDVQQVLGDVDQMLARVRRLRVLNQFFFRDMGFGGNVNNYYDPDNSYLNAVLRTRRGIPISLAVLWLELAQGMGLKARGVNFPGHFMIKINLPNGQVVIDPFTGQSLSREDLSERLEPYKRRNGLVDDFDVPVGLYLQAATPREILARLLRNLKEIHRSQSDWLRVVAVLDRLVILLPQAWVEYRDRGLAWAELGDLRLAVNDLETFVEHTDDALERHNIEQRLQALRRELN
jgi:regulator of sirC expression with transglutaminase-like and TPR domain